MFKQTSLFISLLSLLFLTFLPQKAAAQFCAPTVPTFNVNLTGNPDSTWNSVPTVRIDTCCGVTNPDRCVQFIVTLDTNANGIIMDIPEGGACGARPSGSLFYQVNCGPPVAIGTPVCLNGPGPHFITFCKPGNNANCYQIQSFAGPSASGDVVSQDGCSAELSAGGYDETSITWRSVPNNPVYDGYLDCLIGCDTVTATYAPGAPSFVDYEVCGAPIGACDTTPYCDTLRVFFVSTIDVNIFPDSPTVCFGSGTTDVVAVGTGGAAPYSYLWMDGASNPIPGGTNDSLAVGPGTFIVQITDTLMCTSVRDTVVVTAFSLPIQALPGNDTIICGRDTIPLNGAVQAASGGVWQNGSGIFLPDSAALQGQYIPSPGEYAAGSATLWLITTGNGTCPADTDSVTFTLSPRPLPLITGPVDPCAYTGGNIYSVTNTAGHSYSWAVTGGSISSGQGSNSINVFWNGAGAGTVSLTETNALGCDTTVNYPVTIRPRPAPVITGSPPYCQYSTGNPYSVPATAGNTYSWSVTGGTIASGQGTAAILVDWGVAGPATVQVTEQNSFGCDTTVSISFAINPKPSPTLAGPDSVCAYNSANYSVANVGPDSYAWTVTGGTIGSGQGSNAITVNWAGAGPGTVQLTQTNPFGCDTTLLLNVTLLPNPVAAISGPDSVCQFDAGQVYTTGGSPGNNYLWSVSGGNITAGQGSNAVTITWGSPGNGSVSLTETDPRGCDTTLSFPVVISPKPNPVISGTPPFCEFSTGIPYSVPASAGHAYNWVVTGGIVATGQGSNAITVNWGPAGGGNVQVTETNALGCDTTVSISIVINPTPVPVLSGPDSLCQFSSGLVYSTPASGNSYAWAVSGGTILSGQSTNSITVNWAGAGPASVTLTETNSFGCDSTLILPVTILPKPSPVIQGTPPFCENSQGNGYSVTGSPGNTYNWVVSGGNISFGQGTDSISVNWGPAGSGSVQITETTPEGCDTTVSIPIVINPKPSPSISGPDTLCAYAAGAAYVSANNPGDTYLWTISGGAIASGQGTPSITVNWAGAGSASLSLNQTNAFGCDTTVTFAVELLGNPNTFIAGPSPVCAYSASNYFAAQVAGHTYQWTVSGGSITSGQGSNAISVTWGTPGSGSVSLVQTTSEGCDTAITLNLTIQPAPIPQLSGPLTLCQFSGGHVYTTPVVPGVNYTWTITGGTLQSGQGTPNASVYWDSAGTGTVSLYAVDPLGCDTTISLPVTVLPTPIPQMNPVDTFGCRYLEVPFNASGSQNANSYAWNFGNGQTSTSQAFNATYASPGNYTVTLIATNVSGCSDTIQTVISVSAGPYSDFSYSPGSPVNLDTDTLQWTNLSQNAQQWYWDFGDTTRDTVFTPLHQYDDIGEFVIQLIAEDSLGCRDTSIMPILTIVDINLFVPNAFTPNADGLNDGFYVVSKNLTNFLVQIFDRWGQLLYQSNDPNFIWDGRYQSQDCQEEVYVWKITARGRIGNQIRRAGTVTLLR